MLRKLVAVLNLPVWNGLFLLFCVNATSELSLVISESSSKLFFKILSDVVCRAFYKQSMVKSEVGKMLVYCTWFVSNEDFIISQCLS